MTAFVAKSLAKRNLSFGTTALIESNNNNFWHPRFSSDRRRRRHTVCSFFMIDPSQRVFQTTFEASAPKGFVSKQLPNCDGDAASVKDASARIILSLSSS